MKADQANPFHRYPGLLQFLLHQRQNQRIILLEFDIDQLFRRHDPQKLGKLRQRLPLELLAFEFARVKPAQLGQVGFADFQVDAGGPLRVRIVTDDQPVVSGAVDIAFDPVGQLAAGQLERRQRIFGRLPGGAAMGDVERGGVKSRQKHDGGQREKSEFHGQNPFDLSGGQMRRVAIAGILAMQPDILVLDEPTAGLDPQGRKELMSLFKELHLSGMTIVLVTHLMDDVADYATAVNVMEKGQLVLSGAPKDVFQKVTILKEKHLGVPKITEFALQLQEKGYQFESLPITIEEFVEVVSHG